MNPLSLINPSLEISYCSTSLSNYDIIRLVRFISKIKVEWQNGFFFINSHLILLIIVRRLPCWVVGEIFEN
jgi:hypothetical protein